MFPSVGDLSSHPVNERMAKLEVRSSEVNWQEPPERGTRTQYAVESVADRNQVDKQLEEYVGRREFAVKRILILDVKETVFFFFTSVQR